ncbi:MAG: PAS domain S-box protein [Spirulina sp. DLM2.Bin59]|nr:MAG: PAS domain S-box protein [Spirulina sp. DLM2.Bin59]
MNNPQRLGLLFFKTTILSLLVAGTGIGILYRLAVQNQQAELAERLAAELVALSADPTTGIQRLKTQAEADGGAEQFVIGREEGGTITRPLDQTDGSTPQPLEKAIAGETGTFWSGQAIAAYAPIPDQANWGAVVQIPQQPFSRPYLQVTVITIIAALFLNALGTAIYWLLSRHSLRDLSSSEAQHRLMVDQAPEAMITINDKALIETFNPAAAQMFGYNPNQVIGQGIDRLMLAFADGELETALFGNATLVQAPTTAIQKPGTSPLLTAKRELMGQRQDGGIFPVELAVSRIAAGKEKRYLLMVRDVSDRKQREETLRKRNEELELRVEERTNQLTHLNEELLHEIGERNTAEENLQAIEKRFRTLFNQSEVGILQTSPSGQVVNANPKFLDMVGYSEAELLEKTFQDITHTDDLGNVVSQFRQVLAGELPDLCVEQRYICKDGHLVWVQVSGSVVRDLGGDVEYFLAIVENISDRISTQAALVAKESTISSFFNSTSMMMGVIEIVDQDIRHLADNAVTSEFFRLSPITMHNQMASAMGVPPEIRRHWIDHCYESERKGGPVQFEYSYEPDFESSNGAIRCLAATVCPIPGQGQFSYMVEDVTEQRTQAEALRQAEAQLSQFTGQLHTQRRAMDQLAELNDFLQASRNLDDAQNAIIELVPPLFPDCSGGVFLCNEAGNLLEVVVNWGDHFNSEEIFSPDESWAVRRGRPHWVDYDHPRLLSQHVHYDGQPVECLSLPMISQDRLQGLLYLTSPQPGLLNESRRSFAQTVAEQLAVCLANVKLGSSVKLDRVHDALTGLFNRRYLEEALEREIYSASRQQRAVGIILLDIDYFQQFNNTFGHEAGDAMLRALGRFLQRTAHNMDIAGRYGGEEMAVIIPHTSFDAVRSRATQILDGVKQLRVEYGSQSLDPVTVSIGIALFPENGMTWQALFQSAEMALSRAKVEGRDRLCSIEGQPQG